LKTRLFAALLAATALNGCATLRPTPQNCQRALTGLSAASDIAAVLVRYGYAEEKALAIIAAGELAVRQACAAANVLPSSL
jgi:hypothetical protein